MKPLCRQSACSRFKPSFSVATPYGLIAIATLIKEKIQEVFGYNEETGEVDVYTVTDYHVHDDPITIDLTVDFDLTDDIPGELIETTPEHPFYVLGEWVDAEDLEVGMPLSTYEGIDLVYSGTVTSVERVEETQTMYNLTVDTAHTFFVGEGEWLVHNTNTGCGDLVDLVDFRRQHILNRHGAGAGISGKSEFPARWTDDEAMNFISDVATDPNSTRGVDATAWNTPYAIGMRDGVEIRVDFYPDHVPSGAPHPRAGMISTAYPTNVPRNP